MSRTAAPTVIIPTFNRAEFLQRSIESVLEQTVAVHQLIVVNDGSTDETESIVDHFANVVTYLKIRNGGKPVAINAALPWVTGDYIWVFDDDDVACPDALERHLAVLESRPEVGFTFSSAYYASSHAEGAELRVERELVPREFPEEDFLAELLLESYAASPAVVVRTAVQREAGAYDPELTRSQDWEMAIRWGLIAPGVRLPEARPTYYRRFHGGQRGRAGQEFGDAERVAKARTFERYILRRLSGQVELRHYLPYPEWTEPLRGERRRAALSRRFSVYLRKGMWPEALADLDELADIGFDKDGPRAEEIRFLIRGLARREAVNELREQGMEGELRKRLTHASLRPLRRSLVRGLYYKLRVDLREGRWSDSGRTASVMGRVLDARGLFAQFSHPD